MQHLPSLHIGRLPPELVARENNNIYFAKLYWLTCISRVAFAYISAQSVVCLDPVSSDLCKDELLQQSVSPLSLSVRSKSPDINS